MSATTAPAQRIDMKTYKRIRSEKPTKEPDDTKPLNEIRISAKGRTSTYISYASTLFAPTNPSAEVEAEKESPKLDPTTGKPFQTITFKATGAALSIVVTVVEIIKRRFKGVEQLTKLGSFEIEDEYVPIDKNTDLQPVKQKRSVSFIDITLSRQPGLLNKKDKGFQAALPDSEVEELTAEEMLRNNRGRGQRRGGQKDDDGSDDESGEDERPRKGKGKGKGKKGKGKGKGKKGKGKGKGKRRDGIE